ncbi:hypothetical protein Gasu2_37510 [Galdieria sulphuraria]|uniref:Uncharacterized protein n=1 Tax=Galdieria sulphuraria TaxID=130081 RepID=M2XUP9_GALSU|nr:hypothetical protein Gasu_50790 isoform 1 [Galdieria sulphuraria]EME27348.1 hypothetical protein isoform 1 [Galdieria sulphuraria]GJD09503.1 hypothetical protein Gasu2_37510 [Galdieria sulphuraria]|eukprot:XP_005703868.1 hypothetical protein isoform 1 [Galdieria sulphuraria]
MYNQEQICLYTMKVATNTFCWVVYASICISVFSVTQAVETGCTCPNLYRCENSPINHTRVITRLRTQNLKLVVLEDEVLLQSNYTSDPEWCTIQGLAPVLVGWNFTFSCMGLLDRCLYCNMFTRQNQTTPIYPGGKGVCGVSIWRTAVFAVGMVACTFLVAVGIFFCVRYLQPRLARWRNIRRMIVNEYKSRPKVPMAYVEYGQSLNANVYLCRPESKHIFRTRHGVYHGSKHESQLLSCLPFHTNGWSCLEDCGLKRLSSRLLGERNDTYLISVNVQDAQESTAHEDHE